ncbi:tRNA-dihydrouridine synthase family protein, partial [Candidatus Uhrbacteria bacterium]|nr:tRNA-dihydrouridine synthase family protein [Candidatus Uhrbacteria bacterium]
MRKGFWKQLKTPILALAPMANVTDAAFRHIIAKYGKPDVMWTEFVSCDGLCSNGREKLLVDFMYDESQRPIVAQIFGATPEHFYKTALLIQELGFDGIDINMGCPDRAVEKQGAGAALIKNPELAQEIIRATIRGAADVPVSVKTRIGYTRNTLQEWLPYLLDAGISALTIHGRTRKEMSDVPAHWDAITASVELVRAFDSSDNRPIVLGNGDVASLAEARKKCEEYGVDGVMIGRGIFGNPWLFAEYEPTPTEKMRVLAEHADLFEKLLMGSKHFDIMKKHVKAYISGFDGAKELRI